MFNRCNNFQRICCDGKGDLFRALPTGRIVCRDFIGSILGTGAVPLYLGVVQFSPAWWGWGGGVIHGIFHNLKGINRLGREIEIWGSID